MTLARRFLRGSALNLADQVLRFLAVFIMTPVMVSALGQQRYGLWVLLMSIVGHYSLLDFGLSFSISRFFSRAIGAKDDEGLSVLLSTAFSIMLKIAMIAVIITVIGLVVVPWFGLDGESLKLVRVVILLYGIFLTLGFPVRVYRSLLKSHLRYDLLVAASTLQIVLGSVLIFYFLHKGHGLITLAAVNVSAGLLEYVLVVIAATKTSLKDLEVCKANVDRDKGREIIRYSAVAFVTQLGNSLRLKIDPIIIGSFIGYSSVTLYAIGTRFPLYLTDVIGAVLGGQLLAIFSQSQGKDGKNDDSTVQFLSATRMSTVLALFCGSAMIFYGRAFIERWMGAGFETSGQILMILTIPYIFSLMQYPSLSYIYSLAKHRYLAIITLSAGLLNLVLSVVLVQSVGILGVVWATFIEMLVVYLIVLPNLVCRIGGVSFRQYYGEALGRPLLISSCILAPFYLLVTPLVEASYPRLIVLGGLQVVYFLPLVGLLILSREERSLCLQALKRNR